METVDVADGVIPAAFAVLSSITVTVEVVAGRYTVSLPHPYSSLKFKSVAGQEASQ